MSDDFPGTAYDKWRTEPPEPNRHGFWRWSTDSRGKKIKIWVSDDEAEQEAADDRYDAQKNGDC